MDDETVLETTIQTDPPTEPATEPVQTETAATDPVDVTIPMETQENIWIQEDFVEESVPETTENVIVEVIESVGSDICHTNLFGSFLICGTLVGIVLLRKVYGT